MQTAAFRSTPAHPLAKLVEALTSFRSPLVRTLPYQSQIFGGKTAELLIDALEMLAHGILAGSCAMERI
jgi:hypothetical protein